MAFTRCKVVHRKFLEKRIRRMEMRLREMQKPGGDRGDPGIVVSCIELKTWNHFQSFIFLFKNL